MHVSPGSTTDRLIVAPTTVGRRDGVALTRSRVSVSRLCLSRTRRLRGKDKGLLRTINYADFALLQRI